MQVGVDDALYIIYELGGFYHHTIKNILFLNLNRKKTDFLKKLKIYFKSCLCVYVLYNYNILQVLEYPF